MLIRQTCTYEKKEMYFLSTKKTQQHQNVNLCCKVKS